MGLFQSLRNLFSGRREATAVKMVSTTNNLSLWGNNGYSNDIVRACVNAKALRISKLTLKHVQESTDENGNKTLRVNPWPYLRFLLEEPNRYMTLSAFLFKLSVLTDLTGNAFVLILRDANGLPAEWFPIPAAAAEAEYNADGALFYRFTLRNGQRWRFSADDIMHLRGDFAFNDIFGDTRAKTLDPLIEVAETTDRGIINAIKNSSVIRWLLKYTKSLRPEDLKQNAAEFAENYLNISNGAVGVAATDAKADVEQINPQDYVPNASIMARTPERMMKLFNTNEKIIKSEADEDEENAYYEAVIEPWIIGLAQEATRKNFSRRQRGTGNYFAVGSFNLQAASIKTKLALVSMVDRGGLTVNEWRETMGLPPVEGGNVPIRRLDTAAVTTSGEGGDEGAENN